MALAMCLKASKHQKKFSFRSNTCTRLLTLAEDCKNDTKCKDSSVFFSPHNLHIMSKVFYERYHRPGLEGFLLRSGLDIDLEIGLSIIKWFFNLLEMKEHLHAFYLKTRMKVAWMVQVI